MKQGESKIKWRTKSETEPWCRTGEAVGAEKLIRNGPRERRKIKTKKEENIPNEVYILKREICTIWQCVAHLGL